MVPILTQSITSVNTRRHLVQTNTARLFLSLYLIRPAAFLLRRQSPFHPVPRYQLPAYREPLEVASVADAPPLASRFALLNRWASDRKKTKLNKYHLERRIEEV